MARQLPSLWIALALTLLSCAPALQPPAAQPVYSVAELNRRAFTAGSHWLRGHVAYFYRCPPCPGPEPCEPCLQPHVVFADTPQALADYPRPQPDLLFLSPGEHELEPGARYLIELQAGADASAHGEPPVAGRVLRARKD